MKKEFFMQTIMKHLNKEDDASAPEYVGFGIAAAVICVLVVLALIQGAQ